MLAHNIEQRHTGHKYLHYLAITSVLTGTSACSRVGSDSQTFSDDSKFLNRKGLFLNLGAPSQCQGTVTAWHLRYELDDCRSRSRSSTIDRETVNSVLAVYRPVNNLTMEYEIVPGSTKSVMLACDDDDNDDRTRSDARDEEEMILLEAEERFVIRRGDVIAVCLPSIKKRYRLQILEDVRNGIDIYEYIRKKSVVNGCNFNKLQTIRSQSLRARSSYRLHLHAEIAGTRLVYSLLIILASHQGLPVFSNINIEKHIWKGLGTRLDNIIIYSLIYGRYQSKACHYYFKFSGYIN